VKHIRVQTAEHFASIPEREWFFVPNGTPVEHSYEGFEMKDGKPVFPPPLHYGRWARIRRFFHIHPKATNEFSSPK